MIFEWPFGLFFDYHADITTEWWKQNFEGILKNILKFSDDIFVSTDESTGANLASKT